MHPAYLRIASQMTELETRQWPKWLTASYDWFPSGALQESTQHLEQADASEVQPADEAGDGPDHRHWGEAQRGHRPGLWEGHRRAKLLRGLRKHVPLPRHGKQDVVFSGMDRVCRLQERREACLWGLDRSTELVKLDGGGEWIILPQLWFTLPEKHDMAILL